MPLLLLRRKNSQTKKFAFSRRFACRPVCNNFYSVFRQKPADEARKCTRTLKVQEGQRSSSLSEGNQDALKSG